MPAGRPALTNEDLWKRVDKNGPVPAHMPQFGACWIWTGNLRKGNGGWYGFFSHDSRAWVWAYEQLRGPVPSTKTLDHLCRVTECVNPAHLEIVTERENILRGTGTGANYARRTHCDNGHEYTPENTRITKAGARLCRTCRREASRLEKAKVAVKRRAAGIIPQAEKTHCPKGHPYDEANTVYGPPNASTGVRPRRCKTCNRDRAREKYQRLHA